MGTQLFTTVPQQISILKSRGLQFRSEAAAEAELQRHGYYNIINGYKDNYVIKDASGEHYKDAIYFEQIYSLFSTIGRRITMFRRGCFSRACIFLL